MEIESKALEINLADYHVDVTIDARYSILQEIMSKYYGLMEGLGTFLEELSHPYKNWEFIVREARGYSLDYFHLLKNHPKGPDAALLFVDIFTSAIESECPIPIKADAADNLLLFLQKIIKDSDKEIERFMPAINDSFHRIRNYKEEHFLLFVKSYYQLKKLAEALLQAYQQNAPESEAIHDFKAVNLLLMKYLENSYSIWLNAENPQVWFEKEASGICDSVKCDEIFKDISHNRLTKLKSDLNRIVQEKNTGSIEMLTMLLEMPGYSEVVEIYRQVPQKLLETDKTNIGGNRRKLIFLFHIIKTTGLSIIHKETLREINRTISWLIEHEEYRNIRKLIQKTFSILKELGNKFPVTVLNCVLNIGKGVYKTDEIDLVNFFIDAAIDLGFQTPMIEGVGTDWQIKVNNAHIQNIRVWIELVELNPKWSVRLLSFLIIHLSLCGVFIRDTDLFPRDITRFLNSDIEPVYNLAKQLAKLFPVYFNDIGAEGKLRDISTDLDEITHRKDVLIHFLRKQGHVESSSLIIGFTEAVFRFWQTREKDLLKPFVPPDIYDQIDDRGIYIDGMRKLMLHLHEKGLDLPDAFVAIEGKKLDHLLADISEVSNQDMERLKLAISFYKLLHQKYNLTFSLKTGVEIDNYFAQLKIEAFPDIKNLKKALIEPDLQKKLVMLLDYLELLKTIILSHKTFEIREDIYKKRHFAVDIPSMYGCYHERKFDSLGLTFRIESVVNVLFEQLIEKIDLSIITRATFYQIYDLLKLFNRALNLDGIVSLEIERQFDLLKHLLEVRGFTFSQYIDIFKGFAQAVKNITNDYFNNIHGQNLTGVLSGISVDCLLTKYLSQKNIVDHEKLTHMASEIFLRDKIALSVGLRQLDLFVSRILNTLFRQSDKLPKEKLHLLLNYDPKRVITSIYQPDKMIGGIMHLGNKGFNLVSLYKESLPVPPGFIITTEAFRFRKVIDSYAPAEEKFREQISSHISNLEKVTGKVLGDTKNPLLLSVRSGSAISQPGMMTTLLNVGINEEITAGIAIQTGNPWFAWDNYRRFLQCYGMSFGIERDDFDAIISDFKQKLGVPYKRKFSGEQMKQVALTYKTLIKDAGIDIVDDPLEQLLMAIKIVFNSWESSKAKIYRKIMGISDDWGTAVTVQKMVFGNISRHSGSGVFFTHNPRWSGDILRLWGDFTLGNQGEDVVSGLVNTMPISITQQDIEMRKTNITLESHFPDIYTALKNWANDLIYKKGWGPQEIEFTFESPLMKNLYLLQTREMVMRERKKILVFDPDSVKDDKYLGHGIGVSGGAMSGRVVFDLKEIDAFRDLEPETFLILVRSDTVPDDIREIYAADGMLTARGGLTSHAAVVAHRLGKTCVVGCADLACNEKEKSCLLNKISLKPGDRISIDGREGSVYHGYIKVKEN